MAARADARRAWWMPALLVGDAVAVLVVAVLGFVRGTDEASSPSAPPPTASASPEAISPGATWAVAADGRIQGGPPPTDGALFAADVARRVAAPGPSGGAASTGTPPRLRLIVPPTMTTGTLRQVGSALAAAGVTDVTVDRVGGDDPP